MQSKAGMWHHVGRTMKIVRNTLFVVGGKEEKGRLRTILLGTAAAATQEGIVLRSITLNSHRKNKWLWDGSIQKKAGIKQWNKGRKQGGFLSAMPVAQLWR